MRPEHPLERLERRLKAPPRRRLELLEEVGADAEGLEGELVRRGREPGLARRAALERLVPDGEALDLLAAEHAPFLGRWVRAAGWAERAERVGTAIASLLAAAAAALVIRGFSSAGAASLLAWAQVAVVGLLAANWARAGLELWVGGDLRPERRRTLWRRQAGLALAAVALGALGAAWEGYLALGALDPRASGAAWVALRRAAGFATLGLGAATFGLFAWLSLLPRLITDEAIEHRIAAFFSQGRPPEGAGPFTEARRH